MCAWITSDLYEFTTDSSFTCRVATDDQEPRANPGSPSQWRVPALQGSRPQGHTKCVLSNCLCNFLIRNNMHAEKCFFTCTAWWILKTEHTCWIVEIHSALHRNIATHCAQFCVHPPSLRIMLVGCTHYCRVWLWRVRSHCSAAFCCMHILQCIYPVYCWCVFGWFPVWSCYRPCCCEPFQCLCFGEQMYPFLFGKFVFGIHLVELLYHSW